MRQIAEAAVIAKEHHKLLGPTLQGRMTPYLPPTMAPALIRRQPRRNANPVMNMTISTVRCPAVGGNIAGATVSEIYSISAKSTSLAWAPNWCCRKAGSCG